MSDTSTERGTAKALTGLNVLAPHVFVAASHLASAFGWHPKPENTGLAEAGQASGGKGRTPTSVQPGPGARTETLRAAQR